MLFRSIAYADVIRVCWSCLDFEAAAAHEVGHILGLGHPDLVPNERIGYYGGNPRVSYNTKLTNRGKFDATSCLDPWSSVRDGTSSDATDIDDKTGVRKTLMAAFTAHNPSTCLYADDLEAINTLYPTCDGSMISEVACFKPQLNLGLIRSFYFGLVPLCIGLVISMMIHHFVEEHAEQQVEKLKAQLKGMEGDHKLLQAQLEAKSGATKKKKKKKQVAPAAEGAPAAKVAPAAEVAPAAGVAPAAVVAASTTPAEETKVEPLEMAS